MQPFQSGRWVRMTRHFRIVSAAAFVVALGVVVAPSPRHVEAAEGDCWSKMPWNIFDGSSGTSRSDGDELDSVGAFTVPAPVVAGGVGLAAAHAATYVVGGYAAFMAASMGTCKFLDVMFGVPELLPPVIPSSTVVVEDPEPCSGLTAWWATLPMSSSPDYTPSRCRKVVLPSTVTGSTQLAWYRNTSLTTIERSGVLLTTATFDTPYAWPGSAWNSYDVGGMLAVAGTNRNCSSPEHGFVHLNCSSTTWPSASRPIYIANNCQGNVGSSCGSPPNVVMGLAGPTTDYSWRVLVNSWPEVNARGWERRWVVDIKCDTTWSRSEGDLFWDNAPKRIPVPSCSTGQKLLGYKIMLVPAGVVCGSIATYGPGCTRFTAGTKIGDSDTRWIQEEWNAPSSWTATSPTWQFCLIVGNDCGDPVMVGGVCTWGGFPMPHADNCDPDLQTTADEVTHTGAEVEMTPTTGAVIDTSNPPGTDTEEPTDPEEPGTTVNVPIDPGNDEKCSDPSETACFGGAIDLSSSGECFPDGWGWFNPVQWVLRPIKCAFVWAFVPDDEDLDAFVASVKTSVEGTFPLSLFPVLHDSVSGFAAAASASEAECMAVGVYDAQVECVELPDNLLTTGQRSTITAVMVSLLILGVAFHAVRLVTDR